jgi:hypothetical protein
MIDRLLDQNKPPSGAMEEMTVRNKLGHRPAYTDWFLFQREYFCTN